MSDLTATFKGANMDEDGRPLEITTQIPTPSDPSALTTEQLLREIGRLEKLTERELAARGALSDARMDVIRERLNSINELLKLMETQRVERKEDDRRALDAALAAAEKARIATTDAGDRAIAKTEGATIEQLKLVGAQITSVATGITALVTSLTTRVEKIENIKQGANEQRGSTRQAFSDVQGLIMLGLAVLAGLGIGGVFGP